MVFSSSASRNLVFRLLRSRCALLCRLYHDVSSAALIVGYPHFLIIATRVNIYIYRKKKKEEEEKRETLHPLRPLHLRELKSCNLMINNS